MLDTFKLLNDKRPLVLCPASDNFFFKSTLLKFQVLSEYIQVCMYPSTPLYAPACLPVCLQSEKGKVLSDPCF